MALLTAERYQNYHWPQMRLPVAYVRFDKRTSRPSCTTKKVEWYCSGLPGFTS
jgi:hypothetical protein